MNGAIIAALNEEETIGELVKVLRSYGLEVCVINDGSKDGTEWKALTSGACTLTHKTPQGIRESLIEGWQYALQQGWQRIIQIDAGGSHDPHQIVKLLSSDADVVVGSRFINGSKYIGRKWRSYASRIVASALNFATHKKVKDWTSGYRVFSRKALFVLMNCHYMTKMHTWQIEVLHEAFRKGLTVEEKPITYIAGDSSLKLKTVDDLIKVYLWILNV